MTVSKLRENMLQKVVPEKVMPQNIEALLHSDGESELPELDAFTFLNRLRSLGIGSADFLYLLKGCGAPEAAVSEIERDPAMNLQSLIVTLDGAGLTSQDYTRMLYTARQLWERTLTMRLDAARAPSVTEYAEHSAQSDPAELEYKPQSDPAELEYEPQSDPAEREYEPQDDPAELEYEPQDDPAEREYEPQDDPAEREYEPQDDPAELEYEPQSDPEALNISARVYTETTQFMRAEANALPEDETEESNETEESDEAYEAEESDEPEEYPETKEPAERGAAHTGALVAAAVGALVVIAAGTLAELTDFGALARARYADNYEDIFAQIYASYNAGVIGGENAAPYAVPNEQLFAGILVESTGGQAAVCLDDFAYFAQADSLLVYERGADGLSERAAIEPPEGAQFLCVREENGALYAVFSGETSGAMRLSDGEAAYISEQDGVLTDIAFVDGEVRIGTVYVPPFTQSFTVQDVQEYLPSAGGALIEPQRVLLSDTKGCGYALAARYSAENGGLMGCTAVLGDPVFTRADGTAGVLADGGGLIVQPLETPVFHKTGAISAWACEGGVLALAETQDGTERIYLRGEDMSPLAGFENLAEKPLRLSLSGGTLCAYGENGVFMSADCADPAAPAMLSPERKSGVILGDTALICEKTASGLRLSLHGAQGELCAYEKQLSAQELETLRFGGAQTVFTDGALCGAEYSRFDGVSMVSEYVVFGRQNIVKTLYDDPAGYTAAALVGGEMFVLSGEKALSLP